MFLIHPFLEVEDDFWNMLLVLVACLEAEDVRPLEKLFGDSDLIGSIQRS